jgi:RNA polymerase sigma factor (sigma-70 family)
MLPARHPLVLHRRFGVTLEGSSIRLPHSEPELVRTAAACSHEAFEALMERHRSLLRVVARRFASDEDDRSDLLQEVSVCLLDGRKRALRAWKPIAPFAAYLTTIASRRGIRFAEQQARLPTLVADALPGASEDVLDELLPPEAREALAPLPPQAVEDAERAAHLHAALITLSDRDRFVLRLRFFEGLDSPGIGRMLGVSKGAARKAVFDATRRLRASLLDAGGFSFAPD